MKLKTSIFLSIFISLLFTAEYNFVKARSTKSLIYKSYKVLSPQTKLKMTTKPGSSVSMVFGIVGFSSMVLACLYSLRKRFRMFYWMGRLDSFLNLHILLGLIGPVAILLHTNFKIGGLAGFTFWNMIIVFTTGIIGETIYPVFLKEENTGAHEVGASSSFSQKILGFWHPIHVNFAILMFFLAVIHIIIATLFKVQ